LQFHRQFCNTVPTSSSSASDLKPDSCCLRIAETSAGFISAILLFLEILYKKVFIVTVF
jgi:hypothetical protein